MSAKDDWTNPNDEKPLPTTKKKMSGCMFASLILGGLGVIGFVVCCGGFIALAYMAQPKIVTAPAEVDVLARQILDIQVLPEFTAQEAKSSDIVVFTLRSAKYGHKEGKGTLLMGSLELKFGDANQAKIQLNQFREIEYQQSFSQIVVNKSESVNVTVDGKQVPVTFSEGTNQQTGRDIHLVSFDFVRGTNPTYFVMSLDDDVWDRDAVIKMLEGGKAE